MTTAAATSEAASRLHDLSHRFCWGVPMWCCEAYLQAARERADPVRAIGRAHFGAEYPLYDGDPVWLDEDRRPASRTFCCVRWAQALAQAAEVTHG